MKLFEVTNTEPNRSPLSKVSRAVRAAVPWFEKDAESKGLSSTISKSDVQKDGSSIVNVDLGFPYEWNPHSKELNSTKDIATMHPDPKIQAALRARIASKAGDAEKERMRKFDEWENERKERAKHSAKWRREAMEKIYDAVKGIEGVEQVGVPAAYERNNISGFSITKYKYIPIESFNPDDFDWTKPFRFKFKFKEGSHRENFDLGAAQKKVYSFLTTEFKNNPKLNKLLSISMHGFVTLKGLKPSPDWPGELAYAQYRELRNEHEQETKKKIKEFLSIHKKEIKKDMDELLEKIAKMTEARVTFGFAKFDENWSDYKGIGSFNIRRP